MNQKLVLSDIVSKLKRFSDSVSNHSGSKDLAVNSINKPIILKTIDKSVIESFIISRVDTLKSVPRKKRGFFKKWGICFRIKKNPPRFN